MTLDLDGIFDWIRLYNAIAGVLILFGAPFLVRWWLGLARETRLFCAGAILLTGSLTYGTLEALAREVPHGPRVAVTATALSYMLVAEATVIWAALRSRRKR